MTRRRRRCTMNTCLSTRIMTLGYAWWRSLNHCRAKNQHARQKILERCHEIQIIVIDVIVLQFFPRIGAAHGTATSTTWSSMVSPATPAT